MSQDATTENNALPSCAELDAELSRLLLEDGDGDDATEAWSVRPRSPRTDVRADALEKRIAALEGALDERLEQLHVLAEARIYQAAVDAAYAVRSALGAPSGDEDNVETAPQQ